MHDDRGLKTSGDVRTNDDVVDRVGYWGRVSKGKGKVA
jgi:hypothetical protein